MIAKGGHLPTVALRKEFLMSSLTTRGAPHMTAPTTVPSRSAVSWQHRAASLDFGLYMTRYIALSNAALLICLTIMFLRIDAPLGILRFVQEDTGIERVYLIGVGMFLLFMDISQMTRETRLSWRALTSLSAQCVLAGIALVYFIKGDVSLIGVVTHTSPPCLAIIGIALAAQKQSPLPRINFVKRLPFPVISLVLTCFGVGLILQPDSAIIRFIQTRYGLGMFVLIVAALAWGAGQLRHNHIAPWRAMRRMIGLYLFTLMTVYLFAFDGSVSMLGVMMLLYLSGLTVFIAFIQSQDWAG